MQLSLKQCVLVLFASLALVATPALATWSIVVVNTRTGEVCVGSSTCVPNIDLERFVPVIVPGVGGGAAQSVPDILGTARKAMWDGFHAGDSPEQIFAVITTIPALQSHQYGIVDMLHDPLTFSGHLTGKASNGVTGIVGDLRYAIQGNVLAGYGVVFAAEHALLATKGDLSQRVMAAMLAARNEGGDGRCSCNPSAPTSCGEPPPDFVKASDAVFVALARVGDDEGKCNTADGCASGDYFLNLEYTGKASDPDPVLTLLPMYDAWRAGRAGKPDHIRTLVQTTKKKLAPDGHDAAQVTLVLRDIDEHPIEHGGHQIGLELLAGSSNATQAGPVVDHGDGTYTFELVAGTTPGLDRWRIRIGGFGSRATLQPDLVLQVGP